MSHSNATVRQRLVTSGDGGLSPQEASDLISAEAFISAGDWAAAKHVLVRLASAHRTQPCYRALLAFVLGHEAKDAGEDERAHAQWDRAIQLDPSLELRGIRRRRSSLVQWLFGRQ
jgi:hypothetical protein